MSTTWFEGCDATLATMLGIQLPSASLDGFINPQYDPTYYSKWNRGAYSIRFYYDNTYEDFTKFYVNKSMVIETYTNFEPGYSEFFLWDNHPTHYNLPFKIMYNQLVRIQSHGGKHFMTGRVSLIDPTHYTRREDGTENRKIKIKINDLKIDFKRNEVTEYYPPGVTTYEIMYDLIENHTPFDGSNIDTSKGFVFENGYAIIEQYPATAIQELLDLEVTATLYMNENLEVFIKDKTETGALVMTLNEGNIYQFTKRDGLKIDPIDIILRNKVKFWFTAKYSTGTVNVSEDGATVIGVGTKFKSFIRKGATTEIRFAGHSKVYTVADVNSDTDLTLSSPYEGSTDTGINYTISGYRDFIIVDDAAHAATMAAVLGETGELAGVFSVKMPEKSTPMTREEARAYAESYLRKMMNRAYRGKFITENESFPFDVVEGQAIGIDLSASRDISLQAPIHNLRLEHIGAMTRRDPDMPHHRMVMDFTDRRLLIDGAIERLFQEIKDVEITDDEVIELVKTFYETIGLHDCVGVDKAIGPHDDIGGTGSEEITITELDPAFTEVSNIGPYAIEPLDSTPPFVMLSADTISFFS